MFIVGATENADASHPLIGEVLPGLAIGVDGPIAPELNPVSAKRDSFLLPKEVQSANAVQSWTTLQYVAGKCLSHYWPPFRSKGPTDSINALSVLPGIIYYIQLSVNGR